MAIFFLVNDFTDEMLFEATLMDKDNSYETQRRWAVAVKLVSSSYILFSLVLAIFQSKTRANMLKQNLGGKQEEMRVLMQHYNNFTKYKMVMKVPASGDATVLAFAKMLIQNDLEYIQSTFATGEPISEVYNYTQEDNKVTY